MGTIGHHTLLYDLKHWQIRAAVRGHYRNQRTAWETARFLALVTASINRDPKKPPLTASDLLPLPWEKQESYNAPTEEEIEELRRMMQEENQRNKQHESHNRS